jgi:hypothetical protein
VSFNVGLCGLVGMFLGVSVVPVSEVSMISHLFVAARFVMFGGFLMVTRGQIVVMSGLLVMLSGFVRHRLTPFISYGRWKFAPQTACQTFVDC